MKIPMIELTKSVEKLVNDFIASGEYNRGIGHYENDGMVMTYAKRLSKNQKRKFKRYGTIPSCFTDYMIEKGIIKNRSEIINIQR